MKKARSIVGRSPRAAAALLRLAVQKLIDQILDNQKEKGKGKDLDDNIRILGERGLPKQIQLILNYYRIGGNNAVHPGQIDLKDKRKTAKALFSLLNIIVLIMITNPNKKRLHMMIIHYLMTLGLFDKSRVYIDTQILIGTIIDKTEQKIILFLMRNSYKYVKT